MSWMMRPLTPRNVDGEFRESKIICRSLNNRKDRIEYNYMNIITFAFNNQPFIGTAHTPYPSPSRMSVQIEQCCNEDFTEIILINFAEYIIRWLE